MLFLWLQKQDMFTVEILEMWNYRKPQRKKWKSPPTTPLREIIPVMILFYVLSVFTCIIYIFDVYKVVS